MSQSESGRYSREFMLKAVERLEAGERASALAIELNIQRTIVYHWRDRLRANGAEALTSKRGRPRMAEGLVAQSVRAPRHTVSGLAQAGKARAIDALGDARPWLGREDTGEGKNQ